MRVNVESMFDHFEEQLSAAMAKALLDTVPGVTPKTALRAYRVFRRNAITALSPWEPVPSELFADAGSRTGEEGREGAGARRRGAHAFD